MRAQVILSALAPFALAAGPASAQEGPGSEAELIGRVIGMTEVDRPTCPPAYLCLSSTYLMVLDNVQHVSGPRPDDARGFLVIAHSAYVPGVIVRLRARDVGLPQWQVVERTILGRDDIAASPMHVLSEDTMLLPVDF